MAQCTGAEVLEPGDVLGDHVELDDYARRLAGREVTRQVCARVVPGHLLLVGAQEVRAEVDGPAPVRPFASRGPRREARVLGAHDETKLLAGAARLRG